MSLATQAVAAVKERPILFTGGNVRAILEDRKTQTRRVVQPLPSWQVHSVCKPDGAADPWAVWYHFPETERVGHIRYCPYGKTGDRLYVRESHYRYGNWRKNGLAKSGRQKWTFRAANDEVRFQTELPRPRSRQSVGWWKRPGIFLPKKLARILLEITEVRVQRVQEISEEDCAAEGVQIPVAKVKDPPVECLLDITGPCAPIKYFPDGYFKTDRPGIEERTRIWLRAHFASLWDSINGKRPNCAWKDNPWVWAVSFKRLAQ